MEVKEKEENKREGAGIKIVITKDHNIDDIIKFHKDGYSVHFSGEAEEFVDLNEEDFSRLPKSLLVYYTVALKESQGKLKGVMNTVAEAGTLAREFGYDRRTADPVEQMKLEVPEGYHGKWVRAYDDRVEQMKRQGYIIPRGNQAKSFANDGSKPGAHYVGSEDKPECVAMMIPKEHFKANEQRIKAASNLRKEAVKSQYNGMMERSGVASIND